MLLLVCLFLSLNLRLEPFSFSSLNTMESMSLISSALTIYCGIYYLSDMPEIYNNKDSSIRAYHNGLTISHAQNYILFTVIMLSNLIFYAYWTKKMIFEFRSIIR